MRIGQLGTHRLMREVTPANDAADRDVMALSSRDLDASNMVQWARQTIALVLCKGYANQTTIKKDKLDMTYRDLRADIPMKVLAERAPIRLEESDLQ